jgi:hypothetical protein
MNGDHAAVVIWSRCCAGTPKICVLFPQETGTGRLRVWPSAKQGIVSLTPAWRIYLELEYRVAHLSQAEGALVENTYLGTSQSATSAAGQNLDTDQGQQAMLARSIHPRHPFGPTIAKTRRIHCRFHRSWEAAPFGHGRRAERRDRLALIRPSERRRPQRLRHCRPGAVSAVVRL